MPRPLATVTLLLAAHLPALLGGCSYPSYTSARGTRPAAALPVIEQVALPAPADADLANQPFLHLLRLPGDGYQRGYLYGRAFPAEWKRATDELEGHAVAYLREYVPPKFLARFAVQQYAAIVARNFDDAGSTANMPPEYRAYVQGIADGAGIDASRLLRNIALVMLSDASCSAFVAFGPATDDGRLLQMRNLDWGGVDLPAAQGTVLLLNEPPEGQRWLSIGFVGLVGSISGINESGIAISEIGSESKDKTQNGMPMPILLDDVLARARTLDEAVAIMRKAPGTGGYNYMLGSARERRGVVVEKTARHTAVFEIGPDNYADNPFFDSFAGFDCRADTAADPTVRAVQSCSGGPGSPAGKGAYENRYRKQIELFEGWGRKLDIDRAAELTLAVAPRKNLHSILYDFERGVVYVRNQAWFASGRTDASKEEQMRTRAALQEPAVIDLRRLFRGPFTPLTATATAAPTATPAEAGRPTPTPAVAPSEDSLPPPQIIRR